MAEATGAQCASDEIAVVGAGLVGALVATILQLKGYRVTLYERYGDIRSIPSSGRSINLVATVRGLRALSVLPAQFKADLLALGTHVTGRIIHLDSASEPIFQRYGKDDSEYNHSISRYELNKFLIAQAEAAGVQLHFGHRLVKTDWSGEYATLTFMATGSAGAVPGAEERTLGAAAEGGAGAGAEEEEREVVAQLSGPLIAADGAGSVVRRALADAGLTSFTSEMLGSGYKEMSFPKEAAEAGGMARHGLHIWPRGTHFLMGLADLDGSFTGTFYLANEGERGFAALEAGGVDECRAFLEEHYASALPLLGGAEAAARQLATNHRGILGTVRTETWAVGGKAVLIGDSAHAIVPFFGQGMNCGFEDVKTIVELLETHAPAGAASKDYVAAFAAYEAARKPNANAIADMALENYVEMQKTSAEPDFQKCKAVENALENSRLGERFRSRYAMVCYGGGGVGGVGYAAAQSLGRVQWEINQELATKVSSPEAAAAEVDLELAARLIDEKLAPLQEQLGIDLATVSHHE